MTGWPTAAEAAFHGPAGEFVLRTEPHTEADPMALLTQFLVAFGAAAGPNVRYMVEASAHHLNEFCVLVGPTGKGRKGSSWDHVDALLGDADQAFAKRCVSSGLSSGEGLPDAITWSGHSGPQTSDTGTPRDAATSKCAS